MGMADNLKEDELALCVYKTLQDVCCPLLDGLQLYEVESIKKLLCGPSLHRTDILKWICVSISPSLSGKLSFGAQQEDKMDKEMLQLSHTLMLCKPDEWNLIQGRATPLRQLLYLKQLVMLVPNPQTERSSSDSSSSSGWETSISEMLHKNDAFLDELFSSSHLEQLRQTLNPTCNPWPADVRELLRRDAPRSTMREREEECKRAEAALHTAQAALQDLYAECVFLQGSAASLPTSALRLAISDLSQLMLTFSQIFSSDFRSYCHRKPPELCSRSHIFLHTHQLLEACNGELQLLQQVSDTSKEMSQTAQRLHAEQRGSKQSLSVRLEALKKKHAQFLYQVTVKANTRTMAHLSGGLLYQTMPILSNTLRLWTDLPDLWTLKSRNEIC